MGLLGNESFFPTYLAQLRQYHKTLYYTQHCLDTQLRLDQAYCNDNECTCGSHYNICIFYIVLARIYRANIGMGKTLVNEYWDVWDIFEKKNN